jgi:hypothetical protein
MEKWRKAYKFQVVEAVQFWLDEQLNCDMSALERKICGDRLWDRRWVYQHDVGCAVEIMFL